MAQAPRWRYMRKVVSPLEKGLSLLAILLLLATAGLFYRDYHQPAGASPFTVDPRLLAAPLRSSELVAADYLLPTNKIAARVAMPESVSVQQLSATNLALAQAAQQQKLKHVILATYNLNGRPATVSILDCGSARRAMALWTDRKPADSVVQPIGGAGQVWRTAMAGAFAAGKVYVEVWINGPAATAPAQDTTLAVDDGPALLLNELARVHIFSKPLPEGATGAMVLGAAPPESGPVVKMAGPELTGPGEIRRFNNETLYEKIDGKAQLYLSYNFVELIFTTYAAEDSSFDVYIYDMAQPDNAFGIYKAEESEGATPASIGREGYVSGSSIFFWKGPYYVNVLASGAEEGGGEPGETPAGLAKTLATAIADQIKDTGQSLWAEKVLPAENRVAGSFEFRKSDAFGLDFLKDIFSAEYEVGGQTMTLFVMRVDSPQVAQDIYKKFQDYSAQYGTVLATPQVAGSKTLVAENSNTYDVVFANNSYFGGITAAADKDLATSMLAKWLEEMTR